MDDHFTRLGLPRRFAIDGTTLESQYLARSRALHPDYHAAGSSADQDASIEMSAALNEAYTTLKDPFTRAEYYLSIEGGPSAADRKIMPPEFLAEMLEAREQIEAAKGNSSETERLEKEFSSLYSGLLKRVADHFCGYEQTAAEDPHHPKELDRIRSLLNAAKYVRGLIRDLHAD